MAHKMRVGRRSAPAALIATRTLPALAFGIGTSSLSLSTSGGPHRSKSTARIWTRLVLVPFRMDRVAYNDNRHLIGSTAGRCSSVTLELVIVRSARLGGVIELLEVLSGSGQLCFACGWLRASRFVFTIHR